MIPVGGGAYDTNGIKTVALQINGVDLIRLPLAAHRRQRSGQWLIGCPQPGARTR
ncbi:MAG: hypothetical protein R3E31_20490 [Chloroflexota bacterium]